MLYTGAMEKGQMHGKGALVYPNSEKYEVCASRPEKKTLQTASLIFLSVPARRVTFNMANAMVMAYTATLTAAASRVSGWMTKSMGAAFLFTRRATGESCCRLFYGTG